MQLVVVGCGYVGLVSGACFAEMGHDVVCVDNDAARIERLQAGQIPIFEPGLTEMIGRGAASGRLTFSAHIPPITDQVAAVFIAVGTPPRHDGGGADLSYVMAVAGEIAGKAQNKVLIVIKSTVPAGTGDTVERLVLSVRPQLEVAVASNPEFLREGSALHDFMEPDRIVFGCDDRAALAVLNAIYLPITKFGIPVVATRRRASELIKYAANAFLALKITFINEIADLCEAIDADIDDVAKGVGLDHRIGRAFLSAGPGYGGSCFPKDTAALLATAQEWAVNLRLVETTMAVNDGRKRAMARRVIARLGGDVQGKRIAMLGLTFKPDTDDMRDSPALPLVIALQRAGATVSAYDPEGAEHARTLLPNVRLTKDAYECALRADCVVLATEWSEFTTLDFERLGSTMRTRLFVDLRNAVPAPTLTAAGFTVFGIGRTPRKPASPLPDGKRVVARLRRIAKPELRTSGHAAVAAAPNSPSHQ